MFVVYLHIASFMNTYIYIYIYIFFFFLNFYYYTKVGVPWLVLPRTHIFFFIFIFCIYFLNLITKNIEYPILHLIFTYKKLLFSLLCSQSFPTILSFVYENAIELILLKMKMPKNCFCNLFSFSHFLGIEKKKKNPQTSFSLVGPTKNKK